MKKSFLLIVLLAISQMVFAKPNPNYKSGNGTIISSTEKNGIRTTIRKCEIADIIIGDLLDEEYRTIYESYTFEKSIGKLKDNDNINVLEVCTIE